MTNLQKRQEVGIQGFLKNPKIEARIQEVLGKRADQFASSLVSIVSNDSYLSKADPQTVLTAAMQAAVLDLPIEKSLGFAYIVPYKGSAQFQMGYRGYIQLAQRTGLYKKINVTDVREGELKGWNPLTEDMELEFILDQKERSKAEIIGYAGFFRMINGYEKTVFWTTEEIQEHAQEHSQSYRYDLQKGKSSSVWSTNFDAMARKTVLKLMISKWGMMSVSVQSQQLQEALQADQAVINDLNKKDYDYIDNEEGEVIEAEVIEKEKKTISEAQVEEIEAAANGNDFLLEGVLKNNKYSKISEVKKEDYDKIFKEVYETSKQYDKAMKDKVNDDYIHENK